MTIEEYFRIREQLMATPAYAQDVEWSEGLIDCPGPDEFFREYCFVVCNSGMNFKVGQILFDRVMAAIKEGKVAGTGHGNKRKAEAIRHVYHHRSQLFATYGEQADKLTWLRGLPQIGPVICYHLAKNLGMDVAKPDRHLVRLAGGADKVQEMCKDLALKSGDRVATVDLVIWRACATGLIDSRRIA